MAKIHFFLRNILIVNKIKNVPYISLSELIDYVEAAMQLRGIDNVGISRRTILRDIQNIQTDFSIDVKYSHAQNGYFIESSDLRSDVEQFLDSFDVYTALNMDENIPDFIFAEKHRSRGTQYLFALIRAIKNTLRIRFDYEKFQGETFIERYPKPQMLKEYHEKMQRETSPERYLEPYALKEYHGRWYLMGLSVEHQYMRSYGLDRICNLVVTDDEFKKDTSIDIPEMFQHSFGIYASDMYPVEDVILSFDAVEGHYLKSLPLHHSQEIIKDSEKEFVIKLQIKITPDFVMEIVSRSWSLKVIEPLTLREQVHKIYQNALKRNE
ncbi:MAG: WYL domain-containing protein [Prevotellaceae bacterium]|jgi:predicted DNA-binding transcriptional regulator YafY|nr:WYL domain-containing protein [Prevotellaceae bacterium]